jgi:CheY-like chemotaxis protein
MGITGYSHVCRADRSRLKLFAEIVVKPVTAEDLAERMARLPDKSSGPAELPGETPEKMAGENAGEADGESSRETAGEAQEKPGQHRILVVDDNVVFAESFVILWRRMGHKVEMATGGEEALETARRFRPDVVFCDLSLPGSLDGYAVCRKIKDGEESAPLMIALTGYSEEDVAEEARAAGFDEIAGKMREADELEEMIERHLGGKPSAES